MSVQASCPWAFQRSVRTGTHERVGRGQLRLKTRRRNSGNKKAPLERRLEKRKAHQCLTPQKTDRKPRKRATPG